MQTVTFQCGHCGKLMAVAENSLGQQVRCPHCQQVVLAPPPAAAPTTPPLANASSLPETLFAPPPPPAEHESIFSSPEEGTDDLFGGPPPQIEMPPEPVWIPPPAPLPVNDLPPPDPPPPLPEMPQPPPLQPVEQTVTYLPPQESAAPDIGSLALDGPTVPAQTTAGTAATLPVPAPAAADDTPAESLLPSPPPTVPRAARGGQGGWLVLALLSYAILATVALILIVAMQALFRPPSPLQYLPDEGDKPGATHVGPKGSVYRQSGKNPLLPLSPDLEVALGRSLTVGGLRVTPTKVELRKVRITVLGFRRAEPTADDCLLLYLDLQNVSTDQAFRPLDPFFDREWHGKFDANMPFTYLEAGGQRFYGARTFYPPERAGQRQEVIEGQDLDQVLGPGEKMSTFVCTGPEVAPFLAQYHGPLTFRVRVRRGVVSLGQTETTATAVVGVTFTDKDVVHKPPLEG
jgi:phage FluMu protein Com